jgi:hypothetical protein
MPDRIILSAVFAVFAGTTAFIIIFALSKLFGITNVFKRKWFPAALCAPILILYLVKPYIISSFSFERNYTPDQKNIIECIAKNNKLSEAYKELTKQKKFEITFELLKHSFSEEMAIEYLLKKENVLTNESEMDSYFQLLLSYTLEACMKKE